MQRDMWIYAGLCRVMQMYAYPGASGISRRVWVYLGVSRCIQAYLGVSGRIQACTVASRRIRTYLGISRRIWSHLGAHHAQLFRVELAAQRAHDMHLHRHTTAVRKRGPLPHVHHLGQ